MEQIITQQGSNEISARKMGCPYNSNTNNQCNENQQLIQGQTDDEAFKVYVRVRPLSKKEYEKKNQRKHLHIIKIQDQMVSIMDPDLTYPNGYSREKTYGFDYVFSENDKTLFVYQNTMEPLIDNILNGYNATLFAYGMTGAGKTHTLFGDMQKEILNSDSSGMIMLTFNDLFNRITKPPYANTCEILIKMSYLEIYNEHVKDLLKGDNQNLMIIEDSIKGVIVADLIEIPVNSLEDVLNYILVGNSRRTMASTSANQFSSRSHAIIQVMIEKRYRVKDTETSTISKLSLIDLAGSERATATENKGLRMLEGANINRSLLSLGNCINVLSDQGKKGSFVPYRDSKLTRLLKDSLGGNTKTIMIACISPCYSCYEETINTLKYATRAKNIKKKIEQNVKEVDMQVSQYKDIIEGLKDEITNLKDQLKVKALPLESPRMQNLMTMPNNGNNNNNNNNSNNVNNNSIVESSRTFMKSSYNKDLEIMGILTNVESNLQEPSKKIFLNLEKKWEMNETLRALADLEFQNKQALNLMQKKLESASALTQNDNKKLEQINQQINLLKTTIINNERLKKDIETKLKANITENMNLVENLKECSVYMDTFEDIKFVKKLIEIEKLDIYMQNIEMKRQGLKLIRDMIMKDKHISNLEEEVLTMKMQLEHVNNELLSSKAIIERISLQEMVINGEKELKNHNEKEYKGVEEMEFESHDERENKGYGELEFKNHGEKDFKYPFEKELKIHNKKEFKNLGERESKSLCERELKNYCGKELKNHGERELKNHSEKEFKSYTERELKNNGGKELKNHVERELKNHGERELKNHGGKELKNHVERELKNHGEKELKNHVEGEAKNYVEREVKSHAERESKYHVEREPKSYVEREVKSHPEREFKNYAEREIKNYAEREVKNYVGREAKNYIEREVKNPIEKEFRAYNDRIFKSYIDRDYTDDGRIYEVTEPLEIMENDELILDQPQVEIKSMICIESPLSLRQSTLKSVLETDEIDDKMNSGSSNQRGSNSNNNNNNTRGIQFLNNKTKKRSNSGNSNGKRLNSQGLLVQNENGSNSTTWTPIIEKVSLVNSSLHAKRSFERQKASDHDSNNELKKAASSSPQTKSVKQRIQIHLDAKKDLNNFFAEYKKQKAKPLSIKDENQYRNDPRVVVSDLNIRPFSPTINYESTTKYQKIASMMNKRSSQNAEEILIVAKEEKENLENFNRLYNVNSQKENININKIYSNHIIDTKNKISENSTQQPQAITKFTTENLIQRVTKSQGFTPKNLKSPRFLLHKRTVSCTNPIIKNSSQSINTNGQLESRATPTEMFINKSKQQISAAHNKKNSKEGLMIKANSSKLDKNNEGSVYSDNLQSNRLNGSSSGVVSLTEHNNNLPCNSCNDIRSLDQERENLKLFKSKILGLSSMNLHEKNMSNCILKEIKCLIEESKVNNYIISPREQECLKTLGDLSSKMEGIQDVSLRDKKQRIRFASVNLSKQVQQDKKVTGKTNSVSLQQQQLPTIMDQLSQIPVKKIMIKDFLKKESVSKLDNLSQIPITNKTPQKSNREGSGPNTQNNNMKSPMSFKKGDKCDMMNTIDSSRHQISKLTKNYSISLKDAIDIADTSKEKYESVDTQRYFYTKNFYSMQNVSEKSIENFGSIGDEIILNQRLPKQIQCTKKIDFDYIEQMNGDI